MQLADDLRKLAADLRKEAAEDKTRKLVKTAQIIRGATGLGLLAKKLGRELNAR
jgi:hypothetical protein